MSSQSLIFIEAQNSTNIIQANYSNSKVYIPSTISKGAQEILKSLPMNMSMFVTPSSDDMYGWQELNQQTSSMAIQMSSQSWIAIILILQLPA